MASYGFVSGQPRHKIRLPGVPPRERVRNLRNTKKHSGWSEQSEEKLNRISRMTSSDPLWQSLQIIPSIQLQYFHLQTLEHTFHHLLTLHHKMCAWDIITQSFISEKHIHPPVFIPKGIYVSKNLSHSSPGNPLFRWSQGIPAGDHDEVHVFVPLTFAGLVLQVQHVAAFLAFQKRLPRLEGNFGENNGGKCELQFLEPCQDWNLIQTFTILSWFWYSDIFMY